MNPPPFLVLSLNWGHTAHGGVGAKLARAGE